MFSAQEELDRLRPELRYFRIHFPQIQKARLAQKNRADKLEKDLRIAEGEIKKLKEEKQKLEQEIEKTRKQRDKFKGMIFKANINKPFSDKDSPRKKRLGGQLNYTGNSRRLPQKVDEIKRIFFHHCPNCGNPLDRTDSLETHTVEDIPELEEIKTEVTKFEMERQWCGVCSKEVVATPPGVIPNLRLGLNLIIQG